MRLSNLLFAVVAIGAVWVLKKAWAWKVALDRCAVHVKDPALFRDQVAEERRAILASTLRGPASHGFEAQGDRRERDSAGVRAGAKGSATVKKYASEAGIFVMFVGLHFMPGPAGGLVSWAEVLGIGILLIGIVLMKVGLGDIAGTGK